ncbi:nitroreductase family deazaflavin-dependent oxidoreductase [SAR202 cluster bacterium AD-804-J14_MRT_500m]|nr:nitroreductase family deazaflavin-dependent oxidoreductase [SAR202 cluster bacterium AD-804-J14_MRT_500m]
MLTGPRTIRYKLIGWFGRAHSQALRISHGKFMHSLAGLDVLLLTTKGRRTGRCRYTTLLYIGDDEFYYCVASFGGNDRHPEWYLNLVSEPMAWLLINKRYIKVTASVLAGKQKDDIWIKFIRYYPGFSKYQDKTHRTIPVVQFACTDVVPE